MTLALVFIAYALALSVALGRAGYRPGPVELPAGGSAAQESAPIRVLLIGATGGTGRQLLTQALERGHQVTALVRNPARLATEHPRLTVVHGDVLDAGSVEAAMRGQQAVLCALGHRRFFMPTKILSAGTENLLRAMHSQGVRRLICETSLGIGSSAFRMGLYYTLFVIPVILPFYFWDKTRQERLIAASDRDWIIVRPGVLTHGAARGEYQSGPGVGGYFLTPRISRADVAAFMLRQLGSDERLRSATGVSW